MGIGVTSGVLASPHSQSPLHGLNTGQPKWESHTSGTSTPTIAEGGDHTTVSFHRLHTTKKSQDVCEKFHVATSLVL
jgi:hypothetical protein